MVDTKDLGDAFQGRVAQHLVRHIDQCDHDLAVRLFAGNIAFHPATTQAGKTYKLLNLPYFLGEKLPDYLAWMALNPQGLLPKG